MASRKAIKPDYYATERYGGVTDPLPAGAATEYRRNDERESDDLPGTYRAASRRQQQNLDRDIADRAIRQAEWGRANETATPREIRETNRNIYRLYHPDAARRARRGNGRR